VVASLLSVNLVCNTDKLSFNSSSSLKEVTLCGSMSAECKPCLQR
jgi:hypothetical protein